MFAAVGGCRELGDGGGRQSLGADQASTWLPDEPAATGAEHFGDDADGQPRAHQGDADDGQQPTAHRPTEQRADRVVERRGGHRALALRHERSPPAVVRDDDDRPEPVQGPVPRPPSLGPNEQQPAGRGGTHRDGSVVGAHRDKVPFALGTPITRESTATAARSARATALNWASTMWWGSRPASTRTCRAMPAR